MLPLTDGHCQATLLQLLTKAVVADWKAVLRTFFAAKMSPFIPMTGFTDLKGTDDTQHVNSPIFRDQFYATIAAIEDAAAKLDFYPKNKLEAEVLLQQWKERKLLSNFDTELDQVCINMKYNNNTVSDYYTMPLSHELLGLAGFSNEKAGRKSNPRVFVQI